MLDLSHLTIDRLIVHHIHPRGSNKTFVPPTLGAGIVTLPQSGLDMFTKRIVSALGHQSHGVMAQFAETSEKSFFHEAAALMHGDDANFVGTSGLVAHRLSKAQLSKGLPASKLLVISGKSAQAQKPFAAVIKAELEEALAEKSDKSKTVIDHLTEIFLTESQRLYKIGFVQQTVGATVAAGTASFKSDNYVVHLYDHLMTGTESRHAAMYFYADFLGADVAASDRRLTQDFYEKTLKYIDAQALMPSERIELGEALRSELRSNEQTISVGAFARKHFKTAMQSQYIKSMESSGFPSHDVIKNVDYIKNRLKRRHKIVFTSGVMISTPADKINLVTIQPTSDGSTQVTVTGAVDSTD